MTPSAQNAPKIVKVVKPPRRTRLVGVRFTEDEHARLQAQAEAACVDVSTYARAVLLDEAIPSTAKKATADQKQLARLLVGLGKIGSNVNQIARAANTNGDVPTVAMLEAVTRQMAELRVALREAMEP